MFRERWSSRSRFSLRRAREPPRSKPSAARRVPVAAQCALRIDRWRGGIRAKPVLAPLPDVAEHVVEAKGVRRFLPDCMRPSRSVVVVPGDRVQRAVRFLLGSCLGRVFPLGLGRQPDDPHRLHRIHFRQEDLRVLPAHVIDGRIRIDAVPGAVGTRALSSSRRSESAR